MRKKKKKKRNPIYRVIDRAEGGPTLIEQMEYYNNDLFRFVRGVCVITGDEISQGLYTDEDIDRVGSPLNEMEVIAWMVAQA